MRTSVFGEQGLYDACSVAADVGFDAVKLMGRDPHFGPETIDARARELRGHLDDFGLDVSCVATYMGGYVDRMDSECEAELDALERFCELAEAVGCDRIRHAPDGPPEFRAEEADYERAATWMRSAADLAAKHDMELLVEIHALKILETPAMTRDFLERVSRENVKAIHDAGNMYIAGTGSVTSTSRTSSAPRTRPPGRLTLRAPEASSASSPACSARAPSTTVCSSGRSPNAATTATSPPSANLRR